MGRFDVLKQARKTDLGDLPGSHEAGPEPPPPITSKRGSPNYRQFSAYLRADLYRRLKVKVAERDMDLSDAINEAVQNWIGDSGPEKV